MIFVTGEKHAGKTGLVLELVHQARAKGLYVAGIACPGLWAEGHRTGFDLLEVDTSRRYVLSRRIKGLRPVPYMFDAEGVRKGKEALSVDRCRNADLVIVDEVGPLELKGGGWAQVLPGLLSLSKPVHIWVVRRSLIQAVQDNFQIQAQVFELESAHSLDQVLERLFNPRLVQNGKTHL
jgi:nucleoside-triphosphatase THEP1